ncbi:Hypothetical predicted protein [Paramuricea clavata]|uniref:Uncharacterized protein n=1 Tax=Paramuricea clavata TaxID=317549 RepID=A0A6S7GAN9_PARCT|nr:Hypothetical predicted protein [Paramuricea clavata]
MSKIEIYKKENTILDKELGTYQNGTTKMVFCKWWGQKCVLASGVKSKTNEKFLYKTGIETSFEEVEELIEALNSDYQGLILVRMKRRAVVDEFDAVDLDNSDPEPLEEETSTTTDIEWSVYIGKNDNWAKIKGILREFCIDLHHILNVDEESPIISPPQSPVAQPATTSATTTAVSDVGRPAQPVQTVEQVQIHPPPKKTGKRKQDTKGGQANGNKRAKKNKELHSTEDEQEVSKSIIFDLQLPPPYD